MAPEPEKLLTVPPEMVREELVKPVTAELKMAVTGIGEVAVMAAVGEVIDTVGRRGRGEGLTVGATLSAACDEVIAAVWGVSFPVVRTSMPAWQLSINAKAGTRQIFRRTLLCIV